MLNSKVQTAMLGKDAILHFFMVKGIRDIFYLPGIHTLPLSESFTRYKVHIVVGRHEADLAFMAAGYAEASGGPGALIVTPGPGLGNTVTGCMEAYADDVPLFIIHIDTGREDIGKGILHEITDAKTLFEPFTKAVLTITRREELVPTLSRGFRALLTGRQGPVVISIPYRFLEKDVPFEMEESEEREEAPELDGVRELLEGCRKPLIIGGKSLMRDDLGLAVEEMCLDSGIPFLTTTSGKGVISESSGCAFGNIMAKGIAKEIISSADVVVALGARLRDMDAKRRGVKIGRLIHIDVDDAWVGKNYATELAASGEMKAAIAGLGRILEDLRFDWNLDGLKEKESEEREALKKDSTGFRIVQLIRDVIPEDTATVWDLSILGYWAEYYFPVIHQRTFIMPTGISPTFYGLPAAVGARLGRPDRPVLCVTGDGSFLPCTGDLATVRQYNIPLVILVYNSGSFAILEEYMRSSYGTEGSMMLTNPDFVKLAKSFGIKAKKARTLSHLKDIFRNDVTWSEPFLIELDVPAFPPPWKHVF